MSDIIAGTFSDFKLVRSRKVVQLIIEVPLEKATDALTLLGGMPNPAAETWCGIARLDPSKFQSGDTAPGREAEGSLSRSPVSRPHKPVAADKRLAQRAGILCNDPLFQKWLGEVASDWLLQDDAVVDEHDAANYVRNYCKVDSRSKIVPGTPAGKSFEVLEAAFLGWRDHDMPAEIPA
jgi:hypothetical protein